MAIADGSTEYKISRPFEYHDKSAGGDVTAERLILREPGMDHCKQAFKLQQMVTRLMMEAAEYAKQNADMAGEETPALHDAVDEIEEQAAEMEQAINMALMMSKTVDAGEFVDVWVEAATLGGAKKNLVLVDGSVPLNKVHVARMSPNDVLGAAVRWASFFGMPPQMQNAASGGRSE